MKRLFVVLGALGALMLAMGPASAVPGDVSKYTLFGTMVKATSPTDSHDQVISDDTTGDVFGGASRTIHATVHSLDGLISLDYYFEGRSCAGGSPRIQLAVDTDGDEVSNGNAFGYIGASPNFNTCPTGSWRHEDLTDGQLRWDLTQFGGPFYNTWDMVETFFSLQRAEQVVRGTIVDDSCGFAPTSCGRVYFDTLKIGNLTLENWSDTTR